MVKKIRKHVFNKRGDEFKTNLLELIDHAKKLTEEQKYLQAGLVYQDCKYLAWGYDDKILFESIYDGILCLNQASHELPIESFEAILALHNLSSLIGDFYFMVRDNSGLREAQIKAKEELAYRLIKKAESEPQDKAHYLVSGFQISYDLDCALECIYPDFHINGNQRSYSDERIIYHIAGSFNTLKDIQDFTGCIQIAETNQELFESPELKGWYNAALGWRNPDKSSAYFLHAHESFAEDTHENFEKNGEKKGGWSSINIGLWSPYYLSLHYLSNSVDNPDKGKEWIIKSASVFDENGIQYLEPIVTRYELIVKAIASCLTNPKDFDVELVVKKYKQNSRLTGTLDSDSHVIDFISGLRETLLGFQEDPKEEIRKGRLIQLTEQLNKITVLEETQTKTIDNIIGSEALALCQGPTSWIYRKLESITDEDLLRKILLRLFQSLSPIYAQNIHGIFEHGRDILFLKEESGQLILKLYQVKVGDISTPDWREIKPQLEEMMEVTPPASLELESKEYIKIGILAFNGHIKPIVDPKVEGWQKKRLDEMEEEYQIMHLDKMVKFIFENRLVSEFREILNEYSI